jgi:hypothetical protein
LNWFKRGNKSETKIRIAKHMKAEEFNIIKTQVKEEFKNFIKALDKLEFENA